MKHPALIIASLGFVAALQNFMQKKYGPPLAPANNRAYRRKLAAIERKRAA